MYTLDDISKFNKDNWKLVPQTPGVYLIRLLSASGNFQKINRVINTDDNGLLYIGKSENLRTRIKSLTKTINNLDSTNNHIFGVKYNRNSLFKKTFLPKQLSIIFTTETNCKNKEDELLKNYLHKFGELPPFNSNFPK
jgi:excinuclease UvrABC nuclease subunit